MQCITLCNWDETYNNNNSSSNSKIIIFLHNIIIYYKYNNSIILTTVLVSNCTRTCRPPCPATGRRWCWSPGRNTTWIWRTACGERSTDPCPGTCPTCWWAGRGGCVGTSAGTPSDTLPNSSWPRTSWAQWSSPSRSPRSPPSKGTGSTAAP